jgi:hypothetical protein
MDISQWIYSIRAKTKLKHSEHCCEKVRINFVRF